MESEGDSGACAVCGVFSVAQHHYLVFNETKTWTEAQSFCREQFADLATVDNMEDMNNLNGMAIMELTPAGKKPWIGLFRDSWKWTDGSNSSFRNWKVGRPNNYQNQNENCAVADFESSGQWDDRNCDEKRAFICYAALPHQQTNLKPSSLFAD
uniref:C-type lectin domain-containing protein n=1 Tax=Oryzias latipes TaxID=8090 RepID=A0A3P9K6W1_ORYLA